jgi:hypothetical protein
MMELGVTIDARVAEYRRLLERKNKLVEEGRKQTCLIFNTYADPYFAFQALSKCEQI